MAFHLIDYSEIWYRYLAKTSLPESRSGKFVQIRNDEEEYVVLSPSELSKYHANIVGRFCELRGIRGEYNPKRDYFFVQDSEWEVVGGGFWQLDTMGRTLRLSGASAGYGIFDDENLLKDIGSLEAWKEFSVSVAR
jgi:hypothetical protein